MDQLGRIALSLHLFTNVLEQMLGSTAGQIKIRKEIPTQMVVNAKILIDHILKQNEILLNVSTSNIGNSLSIMSKFRN